MGPFDDKCLIVGIQQLSQGRQTVDTWLMQYNTERPHQSLEFIIPVEYRQVA